MIQKWGKEGAFAAQNQSSLNSLLGKFRFRCVNLLGIVAVALAFACGIGQSQILFQPPANDNFSNAIPLTGYSLSVTSLNTGASSEPGEPAHEGHPPRHSAWWRWVAPENGLAQIKSTLNFNTSNFPVPQLDPVYVGVYTGDEISTLVAVTYLQGSSLNPGGNAVPSYKPTTYIFNVVAGDTYYFAADTISPYTFSLTLTFANLELTQPTILTNLAPNQPVILQFDPVDTNFAIAMLQAFVGTNQLLVLTNDPPQFIYTAEREGTVPVFAFGTNTAGQLLVSLTNYLTFKPPNDDFAEATVISNDIPSFFSTDVHLATSEPGESNIVPGVTFNQTVWWKWTPDYSVPTEFKLTSSGSELLIFRGTTLTNLQLIGRIIPFLFPRGYINTFTFTPESGETYYILGDNLQPFHTIGDGTQSLSWSFVQQTLELTPAGSQQGVVDVPIELEARWLESSSPSSSVDFVIGQIPPGVIFGGPPPIVEIGLVRLSSFPPYHSSWIPTNYGTYYIWARCTNNFGALRESAKTTFQIKFPNDDFAGATLIPSKAKNASYSFSTIGATTEPGERGHSTYPPIATRWWKWTPSYSGIVRLKATRELQAVPLDVYVGSSVANLQPIATNFKRIYRLGISGALSVPVHARQTYFIRVDDFYPDSHELGIPPSSITLTLESATNGPRAEILLSLFKNSRFGPVAFAGVLMPDGSPVKGPGFRAQLYVGTNLNSLHAEAPAQPFWIPIWDYPSPSYGGAPWPAPVILPDVKAYSPVVAQIRVWDSNAGATYEAAQAAGGLIGKSNAVRLIAGSEDAGPARLTGIKSFKLHGLN
jgi:hypothetical protein